MNWAVLAVLVKMHYITQELRNQSKGEKASSFLGGLVSCDANIASSELPLVLVKW